MKWNQETQRKELRKIQRDKFFSGVYPEENREDEKPQRMATERRKMKRTIVFATLLLTVFASTVVEARTWRPKGKPAVIGDFIDVKGDRVQIQTSSGLVEYQYQELSRADQALVKAALQSKGRSAEATALNQGGQGRSETPQPNAEPAETGSTATRQRWRDVNGNELEAEFVRVIGPLVTLRVNGIERNFPVAGFSAADQEWINQQTGTETNPAGAAGVVGNVGGFPGMTLPGSATNSGSAVPPGYSLPPGSTFPVDPSAMANSQGFPGMMPPGSSSAMHSAGPATGTTGIAGGAASSTIPGSYPGAGIPGTYPGTSSAANNFPDASSNMASHGAFPQPTGSSTGFPGAGGMGPGTGPGMPGATGGFPGEMNTGIGGPPPFEPPAFQMPEIPGFSRFNDILKCDNCGTEFTAAAGLKEGDDCPKCSGSNRSYRSNRGVVRGAVAIIALAVGGVGWVIRKIKGSG